MESNWFRARYEPSRKTRQIIERQLTRRVGVLIGNPGQESDKVNSEGREGVLGWELCDDERTRNSLPTDRQAYHPCKNKIPIFRYFFVVKLG